MKAEKIKYLSENFMFKKGATERKLKNYLAKQEAKEAAERNQKLVKSITISIEWKKSRMWSNNPHAEAEVSFSDGAYERKDGYTCSGCGYDKESTVIAGIFNDFLRYKLWAIEDDKEKQDKKPYGINLYYEHSPYYGGGIGTSCYDNISKFIGGSFRRVASGKTFDVFEYIDGVTS